MAEPTTGGRAVVAQTVSGFLVAGVRQVCIRCLEDRASGKVVVEGDNSYSWHAVEAYILSVAALESFVHEAAVITHPFDYLKKLQASRGQIRKWTIEYKYIVMPSRLWGLTFERGTEPFQSFKALVQIRNDLVHYKMNLYPLGSGPRYIRTLESRQILLSGEGWNWVQKISTTKGALWAHNTACRMVYKLMELAGDQAKQLKFAAENFKQIGQNDSVETIRRWQPQFAVTAQVSWR